MKWTNLRLGCMHVYTCSRYIHVHIWPLEFSSLKGPLTDIDRVSSSAGSALKILQREQSLHPEEIFAGTLMAEW